MKNIGRLKNIGFLVKFNAIFLLAIALIPTHLLLSDGEIENRPWYAGTLLAFYPTNAAPGHLSIQPYLFATNKYGIYNRRWSLESRKNINEVDLLLALETGITKWLDVSLYIDTTYERFNKKNSVTYGDTRVFLGFQISIDKKGTWIPDVRFLLGESFPTGKYDHLNLQKGGSDANGTGAFQTSIVFITQKIFHVFPCHPFNVNLNLIFALPVRTEVSGLSVYGGGKGTKGTIQPGNTFIANLGYEFCFNQNWEWGIDFRYEHDNKSTFKNRQDDATIPKAGRPAAESFSIAPSLGYNWSQDFSMAWGVWFTVAGRNSEGFISGVANIYYYF